MGNILDPSCNGLQVNSTISEAAQSGLRIFPVVKRGKKPCIDAWQSKATTNLAQLGEWALQFPECNWGFPTGKASGICVFDVDETLGGETSLAALLSENGCEALPDTVIVSTGKGRHFYFAAPSDGSRIKNSSGEIKPGLDVRGEGGLAVMPPSIHESGKQYRFADESKTTVAFAPQWLLELVIAQEQPSVSSKVQQPRQPATEHERTYASKALRDECNDFAKLPAGTGIRNESLNTMAFKIATMVASGWLEAPAAFTAIWEACGSYRAQDGDDAARGTIESGWKKGILEPRDPLPNTEALYQSIMQNHALIANIKAKFEAMFKAKSEKVDSFTIEGMKSVRDLCKESVKFIISDFIVSGSLTIISGEPGSGKSIFILKMADAIANGKPFWADDDPLEPRPVLYLDRENPGEIIKERQEWLEVTDSQNFRYWGLSQPFESLEPADPVIVDWIKRQTISPVIFIDSYGDFLHGEENSFEANQTFFNSVRVLKRMGVTVVVLHHVGKAETAQFYRGHSSIKANCDTGYLLTNQSLTKENFETFELENWKMRSSVQGRISGHIVDSAFHKVENKQQAKNVLYSLLDGNTGITQTDFVKKAKKNGLSKGKALEFLKKGIVDKSIVEVTQQPNNVHKYATARNTNLLTVANGVAARIASIGGPVFQSHP